MKYQDINFEKFGVSPEEFESLKRLYIDYDKRTKKNLLSEWENPSVCTLNDILSFENFCGLKLPNDYRDFLTFTNGGKPDKNLITIPPSNEKLINSFYGLINRIESFTLRYAFEVFSTRLPTGFLAIGSFEFGDILAIDLTLMNRCEIYWFDHEIELTEEEKKGGIGYIKICDSFSELLCKLRLNDNK
jgi:hypothetical protein